MSRKVMRKNISVPISLYKRMAKEKKANWSAIAAESFRLYLGGATYMINSATEIARLKRKIAEASEALK